MNSFSAKEKLESGLEQNCADDIIEVLCNLGDGTCNYVELIPLLEQVAQKDRFYYFDDNGAGGFPRASGEPSSFKDWALRAIENIKENTKFKANSAVANDLKSLDNQRIKTALKQLSQGHSSDENLIPILEKIAKKDKYDSYSYIGGYSRSPQQFGDLAQQAIQKIKDNLEKEKT